MMADIVRPLALAGSLLGRFWPQLLLIGALSYIARDLLLNAAVAVGLKNALGGMVVLSLVVLTKLMVVVLMFGALRPGMPALASLRQEATVAGGGGDRPATGDHMLAVTAAAILPFFAYYAAWGFLGDTVREYSRLALQRVPFGERLNIFTFVQSQGMVASIAACWAIRWFAKRMNARARSPYWRLLIVAADATWIFIGLYALGVWKNDLITWIGAGAILQSLNEHLPALSMAAHAADGFTPVEFRAAPLFEQLQRLFFYALLPLVWLVMAAIINGYELSAATAPLPAGTSRADTWRKWFKDFVKHFVGGYRSRYQPILTCLRLTLSTGLATLLAFVVAYRALGWIGAWLWYAATRTIGVDDLATWQVVANVLAVFIGSPSDLDGGILLDAARIALLAAVLEHAVASQRTPRPAAATT
ncbi:MAG TPA: hypothetical protein VE527_25715 [Reyranella sp.]|nr:hypothetical protein [Reyranella sp.]